MLPSAVASTGPAFTVRPQQSAVIWQSRRSFVPPPKTCRVVNARPVTAESCYRIAIFQSKAFIMQRITAPHRFRTAGRFCGKIPVFCPAGRRGNKFRGIRVNKTAQRFGGKCLLLQPAKEYACPRRLYSRRLLNQPKTDDIFQIIDFPVCTEFIGQPALAAIRRRIGASNSVPSRLHVPQERNAVCSASR